MVQSEAESAANQQQNQQTSQSHLTLLLVSDCSDVTDETSSGLSVPVIQQLLEMGFWTQHIHRAATELSSPLLLICVFIFT